MPRAWSLAMRLAVVFLCTGCLAGSLDANSRPAVIPKLSELPSEPERRNGVLDGAHVEPGPEQKPKSRKAQKAETIAATAAAYIGSLFSKTQNVTLGTSSSFDENALFDDSTPKKPGRGEGDTKDRKDPPAAAVDAGTLVPWVQLAPRSVTPLPDSP